MPAVHLGKISTNRIRKYIVLIALILLIPAVFSQKNTIIRIEQPTPETIKHFIHKDFDIASLKSGEYIDLVIDNSLLLEIQSLGLNYLILQTDEELKTNILSAKAIAGYRTYAQALAELQQLELTYPNLCKLYLIGQSRGKQYYDAGNTNYAGYQHGIWALKVTQNPEIEADKPAFFFFGAHHAREPLSTEVTFYILNHLLQHYGSDPGITASIQNKEIWFVPIVNPDGHKIVLDLINTTWRKNIRDNDNNGMITSASSVSYPDGVDPNRNYGWEWGGEGSSSTPSSQTYRGPTAFSEPEIQAIKILMASRHFVAGITYHTYSELVMWPYGYIANAVAPDHQAMSQLGYTMASVIPKLGTGYYVAQPMWMLYPAAGNIDDYAYGEHGIFCYTIELATQFIPPAQQVQQVCQDNLQAAMILLNRTNYATLTGIVTNQQNNLPVSAQVFIEGIDNTGLYRKPYRSNPTYGRYYRLLIPGSYNVTFSAWGYETKSFTQVAVHADAPTRLDVLLDPLPFASLSGIVTNQISGLPVANATVYISGSPLAPVATNQNGYYSIDQAYSGLYEVRVESAGNSTIIQSVNLFPGSNTVHFQLTPTSAESFESGIFSPQWSFGGNNPWTIVSGMASHGSKSARSGTITHNQVSSMIYTMDLATSGVISFYRRVSSEPTYDYMAFYINNELKGYWSGEQGWKKFSYDVTAGYTTFRWSYVKDGSVSSGGDCAWVDFIEFPVQASCQAPVSLFADSITSHSARLSWQPISGEALWTLYWGPVGFTPPIQGNVIENLLNTSYTLCGLDAGTEYDFYVKSQCTPVSQSNMAGPKRFRTACSPIEIPFYEWFETETVLCLNYPQGQGNWHIGSEYPLPGSISGPPHAYFDWEPVVQNYSYSLTSPVLDAGYFMNTRLSYELALHNYNNNSVEKMAVEYKTTDTGNWVLLEEFSNEGVGNQTIPLSRQEIPLPGVDYQQFQIRFRAHGSNSFSINGWSIDDVAVEGDLTSVPDTLWLGYGNPLMFGEEDILCFSGIKSVYARNLIVLSGAALSLRAGKSIHLGEGIVVEAGAHFHAFITHNLCEPVNKTAENDRMNEANPVLMHPKPQNNSWIAYPNPTPGPIKVKSLELTGLQDVSFTLYDYTGRLLMIGHHGAEPLTIDMSRFEPGLYLLQIHWNTGSTCLKLIRSR